jgi:hypothetical protein
MPRRAAKNVPGTERYRDERRKGGGPRMHARGWHDHEEPHDLERVADTGRDALIEAESGGDRTGMGRRATGTRPGQSRERRKRTTPPGKGLSKRAAGKRVNAGARGKTRAGSKSGTRRKAAPKGPRRV